MPKLLQRNILRNSYISLISSLIAVVCWSVFMVSGYAYIYTLNTFLLVTCNPEIAISGLQGFVLPDYMYIAPYTKEQRKDLIRKGQRYKFFAVYVWLIIIFVLPFGCIEYMRGNTSALIVCLSEVILSASLLYSNIFSLYIVKRSVYSFWLTFGIKLAMVVSFMMAADKTAGTESVNVIIVLLVIVSSVILILVCRIKYQDKMFSSMADYEYIKKI
ncbi:MAG TPA: hypothetical protein DC028_04550 [Eubacterium sp.]|jgi:hypothetical protein|nr:hypothetical protein [Eubacterium sp.]